METRPFFQNRARSCSGQKSSVYKVQRLNKYKILTRDIRQAMKGDEINASSQKNHSIEAILGIVPRKRSSSKIPKSFVPYPERSTGKNTIDCNG